MSSQYEVLDNLILNAVDSGRSPIYDRSVSAESERIAGATGRDVFRVTDGRLQALRKAKKIEFSAVENGPRAWRRVHQAGAGQ